VEGETLAYQIKKGPIPVEDSLKLALQIAEALEQHMRKASSIAISSPQHQGHS